MQIKSYFIFLLFSNNNIVNPFNYSFPIVLGN